MASRRNAFTLIEMLIVIVIIGILAAALIPRLQSVQGRARDTKRKTDLRNVAQSLEMYKLDNDVYPLPGGCVKYGTGGAPATCYAFGNTSNYVQGVTGTYITTLPYDPINVYNVTYGTLGTGSYIYYYGNVYNTIGGTYNSYNLVALLENTSDTETCIYKSALYKWEYRGQGVGLCAGNTQYLYEQLPYSR